MTMGGPGSCESLLDAAGHALGHDLVDEETLTEGGVLRFQHCDSCGYVRLPMASVCPECLSESFTWVVDSGLGTVSTYCIYHRAFDPAFREAVPYNVALVELDSGPRMISNVLDVPPSDLKVGLRVVGSAIEVTEGRALVYFRPAPGEEP